MSGMWKRQNCKDKPCWNLCKGENMKYINYNMQLEKNNVKYFGFEIFFNNVDRKGYYNKI